MFPKTDEDEKNLPDVICLLILQIIV